MGTKRPAEGEPSLDQPPTLAAPPTLVPPPTLMPPAPAAASSFVCPPEAGQVDHAQLWYYRDHAGLEQGPFSMLSMRSWYEAGYFEGGVTVAASYFGEVPFQYWQIGELWEVPQSQAFVPAEGVEAIVEAPVDDPEFIDSAEFAGAKAGYVFQIGDYGVGYYKNQPPEPVITFETIERERMELKLKVAKIAQSHVSADLGRTT